MCRPVLLGFGVALAAVLVHSPAFAAGVRAFGSRLLVGPAVFGRIGAGLGRRLTNAWGTAALRGTFSLETSFDLVP
jgi:hypothetical protein